MKPRIFLVQEVTEYNSEGGSFIVDGMKLYFSFRKTGGISNVCIMLSNQLVDLFLTEEELLYLENQMNAKLLACCI